MRFVIPRNNLKVFARTVQACAKIGSELRIETNDKTFAIHAVNIAQSAYARFRFGTEFFTTFDIATDFSCKLSMKSCLLVFRSINHMEKTLDECILDIDPEADNLNFQLKYKKGMIKAYKLPLLDGESLELSLDDEENQNIIIGQCRTLLDALTNFPASVEELRIHFSDNKVCFSNYVDDEPDPGKIVHTSVSLDSNEFTTLQTQQDSDAIFCLKEFRAVLKLSEGYSVHVDIRFSTPGSPLRMCFEDESGFKVMMALATLRDSPSSSCATTNGRVITVNRPEPARKKLASSNGPTFSLESVEMPRTSTTVDSVSAASSSREPNKSRSVNGACLTARTSNECSQTLESSQLLGKKSDKVETVLNCTAEPVRRNAVSDAYSSSVSTVPESISSAKELQTRDNLEQEELNEEDDDVIPSTPPSKKFKAYFLGLSSQTSQCTTVLPDPDEILAEASDEEM